MKKYSEILEEIKNARAAMQDTAKTEKEIERAAYMEAAHNGSQQEQEQARAAYRAACDKLAEEERRNNDIEIKITILEENAKHALLSENIATICEIWNKYEGKPHGEKTAQKIRDEIKAATGHAVYIGNKWDDARITIYPAGQRYGLETEAAPKWNGEKQPALNNNKIVKLTAENMRVCYCGDYVENVDDHIKALKEAHAEAEKARDAYRAAIDAYNALTRGKIQHASEREGVKHYII